MAKQAHKKYFQIFLQNLLTQCLICGIIGYKINRYNKQEELKMNYRYAIAKPGSFDGNDENASHVSVTVPGSLIYKTFSADSDISRRVHAGETVWFRCRDYPTATPELITESQVPTIRLLECEQGGSLSDPNDYIKYANKYGRP